ncbi:retinol dehydrogenase 12 [Akanthomyces lecanii RCEF 1005]|uniref:Retinol dehydrogenase 12 n=1 Tax=Akanthomyces lecanii RCEF 1005 TaxID=1081108 RepID=A0A168I5X4_CORDF|nr:retinol dehydrogenase 12 [Akanthomyces lecanii RCEF 1005]
MASAIAYVKNTIAENFGGVAPKLATRQFRLEEVPDQSGKVAVVTGGSEGIGYAITYTLVKNKISKIYMLSLSEEKAKNAVDTIAKDMGSEAGEKIVWMHCDMSDWKRVKEVAESIKESEDRLDILINNAGRGIMTYQLTDYGVDRHMAVNHIGHVVLTTHLLPLMKRTANSGSIVRIVNMSSNLHESVPSDLKFKSLDDLNQDIGAKYQYGRSKLAAILYARYFNRKVTAAGHPNILMNATHPGIVSTKQSTNDIHEPYPIAGYEVSE